MTVNKSTPFQDDDGIVGFKPDELSVYSLPEGNTEMDIERREIEQAGERRFAAVNTRNKYERRQEGGLENTEMHTKHPYLDSPRFDGISPDQNPDIGINPDARWQYENERQEQEKQKELRKENQLQNSKQQTYSHAATPKPF